MTRLLNWLLDDHPLGTFLWGVVLIIVIVIGVVVLVSGAP